MFTRWYKTWLRTVTGPNLEAADGVNAGETTVGTDRGLGLSISTGQVGVKEQDPIFEGGGQVLLGRSYWEKAGWGVALMVALMPCW